VLGKRYRAHRLTGLGAAKPNHVSPRRLVAKIVVESDDSMDLSTREIEHMSDYRYALARHVAKAILDLVQDEHERARPLLQPRCDRFDRRRVEAVFIVVHGQLLVECVKVPPATALSSSGGQSDYHAAEGPREKTPASGSRLV
jgi:hypothetical protein